MGSENSKIKPSDDDPGVKQRPRKPDGLSISDLQGHSKDSSKSEANGKYETEIDPLPIYVEVGKVHIYATAYLSVFLQKPGSSLATPKEDPPPYPESDEIVLTPNDVAFLREYEVYLLLDDSASMTLGDPGETLWQQVSR